MRLNNTVLLIDPLSFSLMELTVPTSFLRLSFLSEFLIKNGFINHVFGDISPNRIKNIFLYHKYQQNYSNYLGCNKNSLEFKEKLSN